MVHLPSRPKRQIIDQWENIFAFGSVRMASFLKQRPTLSKKQNSRLNELIIAAAIYKYGCVGYRCNSAEKRLFAIIKVLKPTDMRKKCQLDDF
jgi:hypothetical protein